MATPVVLDASSVIAYLKREPGAENVAQILEDNSNACLLHAVNACEVFYYFWIRSNENDARKAIKALEADGVLISHDMDRRLWESAARYVSTLKRKPSIADSFCIALAESLSAELVTADHPDFDGAAKQGICTVRFIR